MPPSHKGLRELFTLSADVRDHRAANATSGARHVDRLRADQPHQPNKPAPLTPLEEAVLVVSTGLTGQMTMHDVPAKNDDGSEPVLARRSSTSSRAPPAASTTRMPCRFS